MVPCNVIRLGVPTHAEATDDATNLWSSLCLYVLDEDRVAGPVDDCAEITRWCRDESRVDVCWADVVTAVGEHDLIFSDGVD